jgi:hypothetical protein
MITPDDLKRIIKGGAERIDNPKDCKDYLWSELHSLDLSPDPDNKQASACLKLISKIVGKGQ